MTKYYYAIPTQSDRKACNQALKYFGSKLTIKDIKLLMSSNVERIMIKLNWKYRQYCS